MIRAFLVSVLTLSSIGSAHAGFFTSTAGPLGIPDATISSPYPLSIPFAGVTGTVTSVTVTLTGYSHTFTNDVSMILVGPTGAGSIIFSGGAINSVSGLTLTFADGGSPWPTVGQTLASGTFQPTNDVNGTGRGFGAPAPLIPGVNPTPGAPSLGSFAVFNGLDPNGAWSLYSADFVGQDAGSVTSVTLSITTDDTAGTSAVPIPPTLILMGLGMVGVAGVRRFRKA